MPNTASASLFPCTWAMPQSSRVIVTRLASARHRATSGGEAAVRRKISGARAKTADLRIRQRLLRFPPARKHLRTRALEQLVGVADAEMIATLIVVEFLPGDRRRDRRSFAATRGIRQDRSRAALVAQPIEENALLALDLADVGGEHLRLGLRNCAREALGKALHRRPILRPIQRGDDV